ncbi:MAG: STAS domain-containing protein, partial [Hyphomicrobiales bacterium]
RLAFMLIAAPLMSLVPLAVLASVLAIVSWNMAEKAEFWALIKASAGDRVVLLSTYLLTVFHDLTEGIAVGVILGALIFMHRMAKQVQIDVRAPVDDVADDTATAYDSAASMDAAVMVYRINGPFFFGATATAGSILDRIGDHPRTLILDLSAVPFIDSSGAYMLESFLKTVRKSGTLVVFASAGDAVRRSLAAYGLGEDHVRYAATVDEAIAQARSKGPA